MPEHDRRGPLSDLRVIDLTLMLSGPFCTMLLADLGADVVKIEPPHGDLTRRAGPFREDDELHAFGGYFHSINRNKRSVVLDLKTERGKELLERLVVGADVLVENFRPRVMDRLGLSYEHFRERNPRLVYASIRGFGDPRTGESPYVDWPAFDVTAQAMGGFMGITGMPDGDPTKAGPGVGDIFPAALGAVGILAAAHHAAETGEGQYVDVAMYDGVLSLCERIVYQYSYTGEIPRPQGNTHPILSPFDVFRTRDGWATIAAPTENHWRLLCELMGRPEAAGDERFENNYVRARNSDAVRELVGEWTATLTNDELLVAIGGRVPVAPVNAVDDIFADEHARVREMLVSVEQPGSAEPVTLAGTAIKLTETPGGIYRRGPLLGEHTDEVLAELGLAEAELGELRETGVVK
jgi:crotonobetainyl-CoA:carnitine CoA-transferase CaiB-like acyl-CoA transferase